MVADTSLEKQRGVPAHKIRKCTAVERDSNKHGWYDMWGAEEIINFVTSESLSTEI